MNVLAAAVAYLLGSIPTAYVAVRFATGKTIWEHGSKNVGTLNTYRVTGSLPLALAVLLVDLAKAVAAWWIVAMFWPNSLAVVPFFVVLGHNYPVWTRFRGGRGLAVFLILALIYQPMFFGAWIAIWLLAYILSGYLAVATVVAMVLVPAALVALGIQPNVAILFAEIPVLLRYREKMVALVNGRLPKHYWRETHG
ncbi:MAG: hypothetical protein GXN93_04315 [Candidatus Diapherotrites archaeon]|nr:hypothetical protein [Candidatus Diapherotrites archaeon]